MVHSMTGYGKAERKNKNYIFSVEIKSLNSRYFDIISKIDDRLNEVEHSLIDIVKSKCIRGKIYLTISISKNKSSNSSLTLNESKLEEYVNLSKKIKKKLKLTDEITLNHLMKISNIFDDSFSKTDNNHKILISTLNVAISEFIKYRKSEGENLKLDIIKKMELITKDINKINKLSKKSLSNEYSKYKKKIKRFMLDSKMPLDKDRIYQEIAMLMDKKDINEEIIRFNSHIKLLSSSLRNKSHSGKKINFVMQEMNREINTIGSKTDNIKISHTVVEVKHNLEKIKEQVQNIL